MQTKSTVENEGERWQWQVGGAGSRGGAAMLAAPPFSERLGRALWGDQLCRPRPYTCWRMNHSRRVNWAAARLGFETLVFHRWRLCKTANRPTPYALRRSGRVWRPVGR